MSDPFARRLASERGIALVVTLISLVVVVVLGLAVLHNSVSGLRTSGNDRQLKSAVALAEAGVEYTRETIRTKLRAGQTFNQLLSRAANGGTLVDATTLAGFASTTPTANGTNNTPIVASRAFGSGNFQVFLTNDLLEGGSPSASVEKTTDSNGRIMITSFAGPAGSTATAQAQLGIYDKLYPTAKLPGLITMPGPDVNFQSFASNARLVHGYPKIDCGIGKSAAGGDCGCYPTIAVSTNYAKAKVDAIMCTPGNCSSGQYTSCNSTDGTTTFGGVFRCPTNGQGNGNGNSNGVIQSAGGGGIPGPEFNPSTENFIIATSESDNPYQAYLYDSNPGQRVSNINPPIDSTLKLLAGDPKLTKVTYLDNLKNEVIAAANCCKSARAGVCNPDTPSNCSSPYGTPTSPQIVAVDDDFTVRGNESGAGILLVTGKLTFSGTPTYTGVILVIGKGNFEQNGAGNGTINGAMLIANTEYPCTCTQASCVCSVTKAEAACTASGNCYAGIPTYNINGGGNSEFYYDPTAITWKAAGIMPLDVVSFRLMH